MAGFLRQPVFDLTYRGYPYSARVQDFLAAQKIAEFKIHFIEYLCMLILSIYTLLNLSNVWIIPHTQIE